jgi:hypothetical protein
MALQGTEATDATEGNTISIQSSLLTPSAFEWAAIGNTIISVACFSGASGRPPACALCCMGALAACGDPSNPRSVGPNHHMNSAKAAPQGSTEARLAVDVPPSSIPQPARIWQFSNALLVPQCRAASAASLVHDYVAS